MRVALAAMVLTVAGCYTAVPIVDETAEHPVDDSGAAVCTPRPSPVDMTFDGEAGKVSLSTYYDPCANQARLLVVRIGAAFCGPCRFHAAHTGEVRALGERIALVDLLVSNEDNEPATVSDLASWRAMMDVPPDAMAVDPAYQWRAQMDAPRPLPLYVIFDRRNMTVRATLSDPDPQELANTLRRELDGQPAGEAVPLVDGRFDRERWELLKAMRFDPVPPSDPTNAWADDAGAAALGERLFSDPLLSPSKTISCKTCHDMTKGFADGLPQASGISKGNRNTPSLLLAPHAKRLFWDGRVDTLWGQALGPLENAKEFGGSRQYVVEQLVQRYRESYDAVFTATPLPDPSAADGDAITRAFVNTGKAIAAFERTLRAQPNALDRYVAGDFQALDGAQKDGALRFFQTGCAQCHYGPRLTDEAFHDVHFPSVGIDVGRDAVVDSIAEFSAASRWSDRRASPRAGRRVGPNAWKTPSLRGITATAPYGHAGLFVTLDDVVRHYGGQSRRPLDPRVPGTAEMGLVAFDPVAGGQLTSFLRALTAE